MKKKHLQQTWLQPWENRIKTGATTESRSNWFESNVRDLWLWMFVIVEFWLWLLLDDDNDNDDDDDDGQSYT